MQRDDQIESATRIFRELLANRWNIIRWCFLHSKSCSSPKTSNASAITPANVPEDMTYFVAGREIRHPALDRRSSRIGPAPRHLPALRPLEFPYSYPLRGPAALYSTGGLKILRAAAGFACLW
ncbi:MAG: hypothetical protein WBQ34_14855 [Candidatus Acidiferrales bacterium]